MRANDLLRYYPSFCRDTDDTKVRRQHLPVAQHHGKTDNSGYHSVLGDHEARRRIARCGRESIELALALSCTKRLAERGTPLTMQILHA